MVVPGRLLPLLLTVASLAACTGAPPGPSPAPAPVDTTWYVSARARDDGQDTRRLSDTLEFGLVVTQRASAEDRPTGRIRFRVVDSLQLSRAQFVEALRVQTADHGFAVLYVHGFGTSLEESWDHAIQARARSQGDQPWVSFAWPAIGSGVAWPGADGVLTAAYHKDEASAAASRDAFRLAFGAVRQAVGSDRLLLLTHSMGVQVAAEALVENDGVRADLATAPLRGIGFLAPDVDASRFGDVLVPAVRPLTRRLVLYASADDRALATSRLINSSDRAGLVQRTDGLPIVRPGLESVDITDGTHAESWLKRIISTRHAVRRSSAALFDFVWIVGGARAAECRELLGTAHRAARAVWRLTPGALPTPVRVQQCTGHPPGDDQRAVEGNTMARTSSLSSPPAAGPVKVTVRR